MHINKKCTFVLIFCAVILTCAVAPATQTFADQVDRPAVEAQALGLIQNENGSYSYRESEGLLKNAFKSINGVTYYFGSDGLSVDGSQVIAGKYYYFKNFKMLVNASHDGDYYGRDGVLVTGKWAHNKTGWWYVNPDGSYPKSTFKNINDVTYYFDKSGYMVTGWKKIDGNWYYFKSSGAQVKNATIDGWTLDKDGIGTQKPHWEHNSKGYWYVNADGSYPTSQFLKIDGVEYYFKKDGYMAVGWQKINNKWYYFAKSGAKVVNKTIDGWKIDATGVAKLVAHWASNSSGYWFVNEDGTYPTNTFKEIDGERYYFNGSGYMATGWKQIDGRWFYFGRDGKMQKNKVVDGWRLNDKGIGLEAAHWHKDGSVYYWIEDDGSTFKNGFKKIDGHSYYFDASGIMQIGLKTINGDKYYFTSTGAMAKGIQKIGSSSYLFGSDGRMQKDTWSGDDWYFDAQGVGHTSAWEKKNGRWRYYVLKHKDYARGEIRIIDGKTYRFDAQGYLVTGWFEQNGKTYHYQANGVQDTGVVTIDNKLYYFTDDGVMQKDVTHDGVYFNKKGVGQKPRWEKRNGYWTLRQSDGTLAKNVLRTIDGKTYGFDNQGYMLEGLATVQGKKYYFIRNSGALFNPAGMTSATPYLLFVDTHANRVAGFEKAADGSWRASWEWLCASGRQGLETTSYIRGLYHTNGRTWSKIVKPDFEYYYATRIAGPISFHSVLFYRGASSPWPGQLGNHRSAGCIRLAYENARWVYYNITKGSAVYIY